MRLLCSRNVPIASRFKEPLSEIQTGALVIANRFNIVSALHIPMISSPGWALRIASTPAPISDKSYLISGWIDTAYGYMESESIKNTAGYEDSSVIPMQGTYFFPVQRTILRNP
mgnify:CR=1 FL=1